MMPGATHVVVPDEIIPNRSVSDPIEILSVDLLEQNRVLVEDLRRLARSLGLEFGWHYLLDLTWIINLLGKLERLEVLDAGAGTGVLQWYLAKSGVHVISVDRLNRQWLPLRFRRRFRVHGLRAEADLLPSGRAWLHNFRRPVRGSW